MIIHTYANWGKYCEKCVHSVSLWLLFKLKLQFYKMLRFTCIHFHFQPFYVMFHNLTILYGLITDRVVRYCCQNWYFRNKQQRPLTILSRKILPTHWLEDRDDFLISFYDLTKLACCIRICRKNCNILLPSFGLEQSYNNRVNIL